MKLSETTPSRTKPEAAPSICTIGHSTRSIEELVRILRAHGVERLADVRTIPRSRRVPQFNAEALPKTLAAAGIEYVHLKQLGGLRRPRKDSRNLAWRNDSFRGYADYMETPEFEAALGDLLRLAGEKRTAIMCAEAVYWRCHRSLLADALLCRDVPVLHIFDEKKVEPHRLTRFARIENGRPTYPAEQSFLPGRRGGGPDGRTPVDVG